MNEEIIKILEMFRTGFLNQITNIALAMHDQVKDTRDVEYIKAPGDDVATKSAAVDAMALVSAWIVALGEAQFLDAGYVRVIGNGKPSRCAFEAIVGPLRFEDGSGRPANGLPVVVAEDDGEYFVEVPVVVRVRVNPDFPIDESLRAKANGLITPQIEIIKG